MVGRRSRKVAFVIAQVPHRKQRYNTVGDWIPGKPAKILVSRMKDERYVFLVALHELVEYELCRMKGISDDAVVDFDRGFEAERLAGRHDNGEEPGDDPRAPYRAEHTFATMIEKLVAQKLGVKWSHYEKTAGAMSSRPRMKVKPLLVRRR